MEKGEKDGTLKVGAQMKKNSEKTHKQEESVVICQKRAGLSQLSLKS